MCVGREELRLVEKLLTKFSGLLNIIEELWEQQVKINTYK